MTTPVDVVLIACCPIHGLHGERSECFVCGGPVDQVPMVPAPPVDARVCACGCGESLAGMRADALWHSDAHRMAAKRAPEPEQKPNTTRPQRPGGRQVAFGPINSSIVTGLMDDLGIPASKAERLARKWTIRALPPRQRDQQVHLREAA